MVAVLTSASGCSLMCSKKETGNDGFIIAHFVLRR